jgi:hypothetical protein
MHEYTVLACYLLVVAVPTAIMVCSLLLLLVLRNEAKTWPSQLTHNSRNSILNSPTQPPAQPHPRHHVRIAHPTKPAPAPLGSSPSMACGVMPALLGCRLAPEPDSRLAARPSDPCVARTRQHRCFTVTPTG